MTAAWNALGIDWPNQSTYKCSKAWMFTSWTPPPPIPSTFIFMIYTICLVRTSDPVPHDILLVFDLTFKTQPFNKWKWCQRRQVPNQDYQLWINICFLNWTQNKNFLRNFVNQKYLEAEVVFQLRRNRRREY